MTYFNLRKRYEEGGIDEVDDEPVETEEPGDETPDAPHGPVAALWAGISGPGRWLTARGWPGAAWVLYVGSLWAVGFYGGRVAAGVIGVWLLAVGSFMPREFLDRLTAAIERLHTRAPKPTPETVDEPSVPPLVALMWHHIGAAPGVHVKTLVERLQKEAQEGSEETIDRAAVRAKLGALGIPIKPSVRNAAGRVNEGVHRDDLKGWMEALPSTAAAPSPDPRSGPVATAVTCDVAKRRTPVATPLPRLRRLLSRGAG